MALSFSFLPTVAEANVAARSGEMVVFDTRTGVRVGGPDPEVDLRAAQLVRRWGVEGPASQPDGVSREAYARTVVRTMLYGPQDRRSRR